MFVRHKKYLALATISLFVAAAIAVHMFRLCSPIPMPDAPVMNGHGWGVWAGDTLQSFVHHGAKICIPPGWEPVGAVREGRGWALFPEVQSGVIIRPEAFSTTQLTFEQSAYVVRVVYPKNLANDVLASHLVVIQHAFESVGALYPQANDPLAHTVLVTVGLAGEAVDFETTLYPNPGPTMSILARAHTHERSEELLTHAVMHLHNRHRPDLMAYQKAPGAIPAADLQEMEATWAEVAFRIRDEARRSRVDKLYAVHEAIASGMYTPDLLYPFNEQSHFEAVKFQGVVLPTGSSYSEYQYGHYILAPLVMLGIEGLLLEKNVPPTVADVVTQLHTTPHAELLPILQSVLSSDDIYRIEQWMRGEVMVPREIIDSALKYYANL